MMTLESPKPKFEGDSEFETRLDNLYSLAIPRAKKDPECPKKEYFFNTFFAEKYLGLKPESWRHIKKKRVTISDETLKHLGSALNLPYILFTVPKAGEMTEKEFDSVCLILNWLDANSITISETALFNALKDMLSNDDITETGAQNAVKKALFND